MNASDKRFCRARTPLTREELAAVRERPEGDVQSRLLADLLRCRDALRKKVDCTPLGRSARLRIGKLRPTVGDIVLVRYPPMADYDGELAGTLKELLSQMQSLFPEAFWYLCGSDWGLRTLDAESMRRAGWVKPNGDGAGRAG